MPSWAAGGEGEVGRAGSPETFGQRSPARFHNLSGSLPAFSAGCPWGSCLQGFCGSPCRGFSVPSARPSGSGPAPIYSCPVAHFSPASGSDSLLPVTVFLTTAWCLPLSLPVSVMLRLGRACLGLSSILGSTLTVLSVTPPLSLSCHLSLRITSLPLHLPLSYPLPSWPVHALPLGSPAGPLRVQEERGMG